MAKNVIGKSKTLDMRDMRRCSKCNTQIKYQNLSHYDNIEVWYCEACGRVMKRDMGESKKLYRPHYKRNRTENYIPDRIRIRGKYANNNNLGLNI